MSAICRIKNNSSFLKEYSISFISLQLPYSIFQQYFFSAWSIGTLFKDKGADSILQTSLHQPLEEGDNPGNSLDDGVDEKRIGKNHENGRKNKGKEPQRRGQVEKQK